MRWVGFLFALIVFVVGSRTCTLCWRLDRYVVWRWAQGCVDPDLYRGVYKEGISSMLSE